METKSNSAKTPNSRCVTETIALFVEFLNKAWPVVRSLANDHDWDNDAYFFEDWFDQNWSLLVGRRLIGKKADLQPFCIGIIDIKKQKNRFCIRTEAPAPGILISIGSGEDRFSLEAPFDKVKILKDDGIEEIHSLSSVRFQISECDT